MQRESSNEVQSKARLPILYEDPKKPSTQQARNANYLSRQLSEVKIKQGPVLKANRDIYDYGMRNQSSSVENSPVQKLRTPKVELYPKQKLPKVKNIYANVQARIKSINHDQSRASYSSVKQSNHSGENSNSPHRSMVNYR